MAKNTSIYPRLGKKSEISAEKKNGILAVQNR